MDNHDLISRAAAIGCLGNSPSEMCMPWSEVERMLRALPAVDAVPVTHGYWKDNGNGTVSCSRCATWFPKEREPYLLFCGYCGAKMDGEQKEAEPWN